MPAACGCQLSASTISRRPDAARRSCSVAAVVGGMARALRAACRRCPGRRHLHGGDAGFPASPAGRWRGGWAPRRASRAAASVDVEAAQARQFQHPGRQDQAVGRHHHHLGPRRQQRRARPRRPRRTCRPGAGRAAARRRCPARAKAFTAKPAASCRGRRAVGLGQHEGISNRRRAAGAARRREFRRAGEDDAHRGAAAPQARRIVARFFSILVLMRSRLSAAEGIRRRPCPSGGPSRAARMHTTACPRPELVALAGRGQRRAVTRVAPPHVVDRRHRQAASSPTHHASLRHRDLRVDQHARLVARSPEVSMTITRSCIDLRGRQGRCPPAAYMVSSMSSTSWRMRASTCATGRRRCAGAGRGSGGCSGEPFCHPVDSAGRLCGARTTRRSVTGLTLRAAAARFVAISRV